MSIAILTGFESMNCKSFVISNCRIFSLVLKWFYSKNQGEKYVW